MIWELSLTDEVRQNTFHSFTETWSKYKQTRKKRTLRCLGGEIAQRICLKECIYRSANPPYNYARTFLFTVT